MYIILNVGFHALISLQTRCDEEDACSVQVDEYIHEEDPSWVLSAS